MGAKQEATEWAEIVRRFGERHELTYESVGGIKPKDGPVALCVGGSNRLTGQPVRPTDAERHRPVLGLDPADRLVGQFMALAKSPHDLGPFRGFLLRAHVPILCSGVQTACVWARGRK